MRIEKMIMMGKGESQLILNETIIQSTLMLAHSIRKIIAAFAKSTDTLNTALIATSIKKTKKVDRQLTLLKRTLASKEPLPSQSLYDEYHHREVYKRIDTDLQAFFYKREYNLENFNFLVNLLGHQNKLTYLPEVIRKMELMNITPDQRTYNYIVKAASMQNDAQLAEAYFKTAVQKFGHSKYFYTSLMQVYVGSKNPEMAYKILQEMIEKGISPDLPVYTTLINSFRLGRKLEKCWQLNKMILKSKVELDETYAGVMFKVHAATHDAEMAIKLYQEIIIGKRVKPMLETTNSYFKALSTRPEYSQRVIDQFIDMVEHGEIINTETVQWALKAASTTANVKSAIEIIKIMKLNKIQPNKQIYNSLIRVYAKACDVPEISEAHRQMMLTDTWKILEEVINKNMLDTMIVNNVMLVYANALQEDKIEGLILPLYEKFNLQMDPYSYEILVDLNYKKKDFNTAIRVWEQMKAKLEQKRQTEIEKYGVYKASTDLMRQDLRPTFNSLELYIQMGIRLMDMNMILEGLNWFKKLKRHPKNSTLKFLGTLKNLPEEIVASLMDFQIKFGAAKVSKTQRDKERSIPDPQNK